MTPPPSHFLTFSLSHFPLCPFSPSPFRVVRMFRGCEFHFGKLSRCASKYLASSSGTSGRNR
jgi:hypothetical protein